jgi:DNA (cytosine-5)-methyltransferase 1
MRVLDLFSGIGGFSLGLERAGMQTVAFCEIEPYCRAVLRKHWPNVPCYEDVRNLTADRLRADGISIDVICGGFPCQDISTAGKGAGLAGARSGLFYEIARLIGELGPRYVILENVAALLSRGLDQVLGTLASLGYDAEWHCIPASAIGAPHRRDRIWIVAYSNSTQCQGNGLSSRIYSQFNGSWIDRSKTKDVANAFSFGQSGSGEFGDASHSTSNGKGQAIKSLNGGIGQIWRTEPNVGRVANGVPNRVDRLKALGNAVVPQIPEIIGRAIMEAEKL